MSLGAPLSIGYLKALGFDVGLVEPAVTTADCGSAAPRSVDSFGLEVTTAEGACCSAVGEYYLAVLAYRPFSAWAVADDAVAHDSFCPMARVLAADYAFCRGDAMVAKAHLAELTATKRSAAEAWTWRERQYVEAWKQWVEGGDPAGCYAVLLGVVRRHPSDLFAVKRGQIMGLILGEGAKILEIVQAAAAGSDVAAPPRFLHGMWAFGLEQQGLYEEAEEKAREGLALPGQLADDAWLDHGLAHALYFQGDDRLDEALEFLQERSVRWGAADLHPFLYTHNWWHMSLLHCERRDAKAALEIFDTRLWADANMEMRSDPQVQLNALNLLWRLATRGESQAVGGRWTAVLSACEGTTLPRADGSAAASQHCDLLLDVLLVRALCARGAAEVKRLDAFVASAEAHAAGLQGSAGGRARGSTYLTIVKAVASKFRTDLPEAGALAREAAARQEIRALRPWEAIGGSEEQRGVLLEAVEGPVVCGEPERNFSTLFF